MSDAKDSAELRAIREQIIGSAEPDPEHNEGASMHDLVIEDMRKRKEFGLTKYGTVLQAHNGRNALRDAYDEVLDLAVYLRQRIEEDEKLRRLAGAAVTADIPPMLRPDGWRQCPKRGPHQRQCIYQEGHLGRHRA
ncbi:hypothetical protein SEA_NOSILAM_6 [Gordonia phage NosilaM]|uniref:Uncharacterized protein n=1 Tax=Gordonia phage NosilaM TaxID=2507863 RepID=A0A410TDZ6_9CAUD|nr:hypothetical protein KNU46_gp06 [Gordonia phage NosilaM]QAU07249.1 hypothetical protein SEA_NOSILAM_6 [Gordonia phage NosilaM]